MFVNSSVVNLKILKQIVFVIGYHILLCLFIYQFEIGRIGPHVFFLKGDLYVE